MSDPSLVVAMLNSPRNLLGRVVTLEQQVHELQTAERPAAPADDGPFVAPLILSPAQGVLVTDPTSTDYTGSFTAGEGIDFSGTIYISANVVNGVVKTGFTDVGTLYAVDAVVSGTITIGTGSSAGGWLINSTSIFNGNISLDSSIPAIKIGGATDYLTGTGIFMGLNSAAYKMSVGSPTVYFAFNGTVPIASGGWIGSAGVNPALQEWETNIVFSSASDTQINWTSGTLRLSDGTSYSISSGNTGAMAALTYIYLDVAVSSTVLQITTTYTTATGDGKVLIAAAQNASAGASVLPFGGQQPIINGGLQLTALSVLAANIAAGAVTASKISVVSLSAITATMGSLTIDSTLTMNGASGAIAIGTTPPSSATSGTGLWIDRTGVYSLSSNVQNATLSSAGLSAGGGALVIDSSSIHMNGASILASSIMNSGVGYDRYYVGGFDFLGITFTGASEIQKRFGQLMVHLVTGTNLITNGTFAGGVATSWTATGSPTVATDSPNGTYSAEVSNTNYYTQDITTVSGSDYLVVCMAKSLVSKYPLLTIGANSAFTMLSINAGLWVLEVCMFRATAATTTIKLNGTGGSGNVRLTNVEMYASDSWSYLGDRDTDLLGNMELMSSKNLFLGSYKSVNPIVAVNQAVQVKEVATPGAGAMLSGFGAYYFKSDHLPYAKANGIEMPLYAGGISIYGAGVDGAAVLDGVNTFTFASLVGSTYTLLRNVWATDFTVNNGQTLIGAGYSIACTGTFTNAGTTHNDGGDASGATGGTGVTGFYITGAPGATGIASGAAAGPGVNASTVASNKTLLGGMGGRAAAAWASAITQIGGSVTSFDSAWYPDAARGSWRASQNIDNLINSFIPISTSANVQWRGGAGGGSGGKSAVGTTCNSGGGGSGGGILVIRARKIVNSGTIRSAGGIGGNAGGTGANAGGGAGGGGGLVGLVYDTLTNTGTISAPGGAGGTSVALGTTPKRAVIRAFANSTVGSSVTTRVATPTLPPANNTLYIAWTHTTGGSLTTPALTGFGLTWNLIAIKDFNTIASPANRLALFYAYGTPVIDGDSLGITATWSSAPTTSQLIVEEIQNASGTIVQNVSNSTNSATTLTCTLAGLGSTDAAVFAVFAFAGGTARVAGAGFTIVGDFTSTPLSTSEMSYNDTTADITWTTLAAAAGIAIEIQAVASMENGQNGMPGVVVQLTNNL